MKRRTFLRGATIGVALSRVLDGWPAWAVAADPERPATTGLTDLVDRYREASSKGKPLLVFVIAADPVEAAFRGTAFGELLMHGSASDVAPLALSDVACAEMAAVRRLALGAPSGEPLMVLVESDGTSPDARSIDVALPRETKRVAEAWQERERRLAGFADRRIAALGAALRANLLDDRPLARRVVAARGKLSAVYARRAANAARSMLGPALEVADAAAAIVASAARAKSVAVEAFATDLLARAVRARLSKKPPPGSRWARGSGCGVDEIEGMPPGRARALLGRIGCGMGVVPEKSRRFLYFFTSR